MLPNHSLWIHQLNRVRSVTELTEDLTADTVIVGGGIAGIVSGEQIASSMFDSER